MHTVTRHEAFAVRRQRVRSSGTAVVENEDGEELDALDLIASERPEPAEMGERSEKLARSREALRLLKPNEVRALTLKAEGFSYAEISEVTGWTRTKINRLMVEGRSRFLGFFSDIEEGRRCDELSATLSKVADGEEPNAPALREHLRQCAHCRAKLKAYRGVPQRVLELAPVGMLAGPTFRDRVGDQLIAGVDRARELAMGLVHRGGAVDATQAVAAGGGPRGSGLAILGIVCGLGAAGGGTYCAVQGVSPTDVVPGLAAPSEPAQPVAPQPTPAAPTAEELKAAEQAASEEAAQPQTPAQQATREFGIGSGQPQSASGTTEFGAPAGGGSGGGGGGSGSGGGFGFEK